MVKNIPYHLQYPITCRALYIPQVGDPWDFWLPSVLRHRTHPLQVLMKAFEQGGGLQKTTKPPRNGRVFWKILGEDEVNLAKFGMICSDLSQGGPPNF